MDHQGGATVGETTHGGVVECGFYTMFTPQSKGKAKKQKKKVICLYYALKYQDFSFKKDILANAPIIKTVSAKNLQNTL